MVTFILNILKDILQVKTYYCETLNVCGDDGMADTEACKSFAVVL